MAKKPARLLLSFLIFNFFRQRRISLWLTFLIALASSLLILSYRPALALVCTSPKKGAVGGTSLVGATTYRYLPYSDNLQVAPMLKRWHVEELRRQPNPDICDIPRPGCNGTECCEHTEWGWPHCCPAYAIKKTIQNRSPGGYWLIFNEPMNEDAYTTDFKGTSGRQAADDAAFAISKIKTMDPTAKFIVGWLYYRWYDTQGLHETSIASEWASVAPAYSLNPDINQEIAGWSVHYIDAATIAAAPPAWPLIRISPNKEIWVTELGTLGDQQCYYLKLNDPTTAVGCINYMTNLVYGMENSPYITKYFWWSFNACDPAYPQYSGCWGPLFVNNSLNKLGEAFAAIPNDNGVCRYSSTNPTSTPIPIPPSRTPTPSPTSIPPSPSPTPLLPTSTPTNQPVPGDVNGDGHVNMADYSLFVSKYGTNDSSCDFNKNGLVDMGDYGILVNNYGK